MGDNLALPIVAASQTQKEVPINAATQQLSSALADFLSASLASGDYTLTTPNFQDYMGFSTTGNSVARSFNVPAVKRALFLVYNGGSATLAVVRGSTSINVLAGSFGQFQTDGTTNGLVRVVGSSSLIQNIAFCIAGSPPASMNIVASFNQAMKLSATLPGSNFFIGTNPTGTMTFDLVKISSGTPTSIGSVAFSTSGVPTVTFSSDVSFAAGDVLKVTAPGSQDATGADISFNFQATIL